MSLLPPVPISLQPAPFHRKRTSSFSYPAQVDTAFSPNPRPTKAQRITPTPMGSPLRRSETMVAIPESNTIKEPVPYYRVLQRHKDDRLRRKGLLTRSSAAAADLTITTQLTSRPRLEVTPVTQPRPSSSCSKPPPSAAPKPLNPKPRKHSSSSSSSTPTTFTPTYVYSKKRAAPTIPPQIILPSASSPITILRTHRTSSPLAPTQTPLPGRPVFPRSKPEPDLYKTAIKMRMRGSPEGLRILHMGPRLALSIMDATKELEKIVAAQQERERDREGDVVMGDSTATTMSTAGFVSGTSLAMPVLTASWVVVKGEDWEMVDCAA